MAPWYLYVCVCQGERGCFAHSPLINVDICSAALDTLSLQRHKSLASVNSGIDPQIKCRSLWDRCCYLYFLFLRNLPTLMAVCLHLLIFCLLSCFIVLLARDSRLLLLHIYGNLYWEVSQCWLSESVIKVYLYNRLWFDHMYSKEVPLKSNLLNFAHLCQGLGVTKYTEFRQVIS